jgi:hypothetical protein
MGIFWKQGLRLMGLVPSRDRDGERCLGSRLVSESIQNLFGWLRGHGLPLTKFKFTQIFMLICTRERKLNL